MFHPSCGWHKKKACSISASGRLCFSQRWTSSESYTAIGDDQGGGRPRRQDAIMSPVSTSCSCKLSASSSVSSKSVYNSMAPRINHKIASVNVRVFIRVSPNKVLTHLLPIGRPKINPLGHFGVLLPLRKPTRRMHLLPLAGTHRRRLSDAEEGEE